METRNPLWGKANLPTLLRDFFQRSRTSSISEVRTQSSVADEAGQSLVEFAVTLPVLFTFLFCFMELCLAFYTHDLISELAREGTRYAMVRGATCTTTASASCEVTASQVQTYVLGLGFPNIGGGTITVDPSVYPDGNESIGSRVQVKVSYVFPIKMPFVPKQSITMTSTSLAYIVQ